MLSVLLKYIMEHQEEICRISSKDSGKPMVDCAFGELIVTCEKIRWLMSEGERWLKPESRSAGRMMFYKKARVEYIPLGVVGAIVPFNYPFHNIYNPMVAALFAGNGIVIKVSEHASWSALYYAEGIRRALDAAGAPPDLVQIVTGYGNAGHALVTSGVDKVIFVGSTEVGKKVMASAADTLDARCSGAGRQGRLYCVRGCGSEERGAYGPPGGLPGLWPELHGRRAVHRARKSRSTAFWTFA